IAEYKKVLNIKTVDEKEIRDCLSLLVSDKSIVFRSGNYHISTSKQTKINSSYEESNNRKLEIIDSYFKPFFSNEQDVIEWLEDSTITFFQNYSNEWMADLCNNSIHAVISSKENILSTICIKTKQNKKIDKNDKDDLCKKFCHFITTNDINVNTYLWEYGTSAFSAQLIKNSVGTDKISIQTFENSKCVLDTNILMHIGLEKSEYSKSLKSLEEVFEKLNIKVGILNITKEEYKNTLGNKQDEVLKMIEKYPLEVIKEVNDQYIKTALARNCTNYSDFETFFNKLIDPPKVLEEKMEIKIFDDDAKLEEIVDKAKNDKIKQNELNTIFKKITGHDKRPNALMHDVGLIAGVNYLRDGDKYFILSQEVSINNYSKQKPFIYDLPLAIKLETIINILAVNTGGVDVDSSDYIPLFASMVRNGFTPNKDTFKVVDLSLMLEKNQQIAQLPSEDTIRIAKDVHRRRLLGESEDKISLELTREIQGVKLQIVDDLEETKSKLVYVQQEKENYKDSSNRSRNALENTIRKNVEKEFQKGLQKKRLFYFLTLPVLFLSLSILILYLIKNNFEVINWVSNIISIILNVISDLCIILIRGLPEIKKYKNTKETWISDETDKRLTLALDGK
ncbi:MAG: hypothetical protein RBT05_08605, partial [Bacteroidales bacterium]|nr:hypothetical protein [Bacteroidales bacterium]